MTVSREDVELITGSIIDNGRLCDDEIDRLVKIVEDRLNQPTVANNASVDWKSIAEEMYKVLRGCQDIFNEMDSITWDDDSSWQHSSYEEISYDVGDLMEKYEQAIKGE